jgi:DNA polymerase-1
MSGDENLAYQFLDGDIHSFVTNSLEGERLQRLFGSIITPELKENNSAAKIIRDKFKSVSYGIVYGSTGYNLYRTLYFDLAGQGLHVTQEDADRWVEDWKNKLFPRTGKLLQQNSEYAVLRYYTTSALGRRRRWLPEVRTDKWRMLAAMREGSNQPIQATCSDMIKMAMLRFDQTADLRRCALVACIHDELLIESDQDYTVEGMGIAKYAMESVAREMFPEADPRLFGAQPKSSNKYDK